MSTIQDLFQQAQLAEAAYADLSSAIGNQGELQKALDVAFKGQYGGSFSATQATDFIAHWRVVSQQPDTGSGFSATVFQNIDTGAYSFSIRGSKQLVDFGADAKTITTDGIAVAQLVDMYNYWQSLTHLGVYQAATLTIQEIIGDRPEWRLLNATI